MFRNTVGTKRRFKRTGISVALAALIVTFVGVAPASAAGYKYMGQHQGTYYYMCKASSTLIKVKGTPTTSSSGYSYRIEGRNSSSSYYSYGTTVAKSIYNSSYVSVPVTTSATTIVVRSKMWDSPYSGAYSNTASYPISSIPYC